jgi:hypothetical protein
MSMMDVCGPVFCPECEPIYNRRGEPVGPQLECSESNYSGCGADMANCPKCGKGWCISFQVDEVTRAEVWDVEIPTEEEIRAERERERQAKVERLQKEIETLQQEQKKAAGSQKAESRDRG